MDGKYINLTLTCLLKKTELNPANSITNVHLDNNLNRDIDLTDKIILDVGEFCAALFDGEWYIGAVTEKRLGEMKINFMEEAGTLGDSFKWPVKRGEVWIPEKDIPMKIPEPVPSGKRKRIFKLGLEINSV